MDGRWPTISLASGSPKNNLVPLVPLVPRSALLAITFSFCLFSGIEKTGHHGNQGHQHRKPAVLAAKGTGKLCWPMFPLPRLALPQDLPACGPASRPRRWEWTHCGSREGKGQGCNDPVNRGQQDQSRPHPSLTHRTFSLAKIAAPASTTRLLSSVRQALLYDAAPDAFRGKDTVLDWFATITQVGSREGSTVHSPIRMHDDRAANNVLAAGGCQLNSPLPFSPAASPARLWASVQSERVGMGAAAQR